MPVKMKQVKEKIYADSYSVSHGVFTLRWGFFYTFGKTAEDFAKKVKQAFPSAEILEAEEVWKAFVGGAPLARQSHWYVRFTIKGD